MRLSMVDNTSQSSVAGFNRRTIALV